MSTKAVEDGASERGEGGVHSYSTKASSPSMGDLSTRCEDTRTAALSLSMLNVGYSSTSLGNCGREGELEGIGGRGMREEEERGTLAPETPQRAARPTPGTPLTPMANLKVLIAAASSALERESASSGRSGDRTDGGMGGDDVGGRKMKSLSILCQRFLSIAESEVGVGNDFSLELMSQNLGTNRRRIYDIINVLEALEMIVKQSKNWYTWLGKENLLLTLAKMRAMAQDDPDFRHLRKESSVQTSSKSTESSTHRPPPFSDKTNLPSNPSSPKRKSSQNSDENQAPHVLAITTQSGNAAPADFTAKDAAPCDDQDLQDSQQSSISCEEGMPPSTVCGACGGNGNGGRWDKSLGVLCQKFVMLFLVTPEHEVTLDYAGNMLMPDCVDSMGNPFAAMHQPTNPKTKVRRLYDIANVLTTLGLIKKKTFLAPNHRKMPGYAWAGPSMEEIQAIPVFRKNEFNLYPFYSKKKGGGAGSSSQLGGVGLTRKASFGAGGGGGGVRPFLHQYEVKGQQSSTSKSDVPANKTDDSSSEQGKHSSAPSTPVKSRVVRRTLSFGAKPSSKGSGGGGGSKRVNRPSSLSSSNSASSCSGGAGSSSSSKQSSSYVPIAPAPPPPSSSSSNKCVVARPLAPKQVDYMNEVKEFEAEMRKHSHKFPHVASVFQEFIQKYQSTLEQAASAGRTILPKPISMEDCTPFGIFSGHPQPAINSQNLNHLSTPTSPKPVTATVLPANSVPQSNAGSATVTAGSLFSSNGQKEVPMSLTVANTEKSEGCKFVESSQQTDNNCGVIPLLSSSSSSTQPPPLVQMGGLDIADLAKTGGQNVCQSIPSGRVSPAPTLTSGTHGIIRSPGPTGPNAFMSVEDILVPPSENQATCKGTQTSSSSNLHTNLNNSVPPSSVTNNNRPTMLTALLKSGCTTANNNQTQSQRQSSGANGASSSTSTAAAQSSTTTQQQQQALVTHLLHTLVNQSPIPTPTAFKKPAPPPTVSTSKSDSVAMVANCAPAVSTCKVPPQQIQHASVPMPHRGTGTGFNPSIFLANPAQQQVMTTAGAILSPNALVPYLNPFPTIYNSGLVQQQAVPSTCGILDPSTAVKNFQMSRGPATVTLPTTTVPISRDTGVNKPSPPKKPRLG